MSTDFLIKKFNIPLETDIIAICPGASGGEAKKWPKKYFSELIKDLTKKDFIEELKSRKKKWVLFFPNIPSPSLSYPLWNTKVPC